MGTNDIAAVINKENGVLRECLQGEIGGRLVFKELYCCLKSKPLEPEVDGPRQTTYTYA
jgi:hypothetical protein